MMTSSCILISIYFYYLWYMACHNPELDVECFNFKDECPFLIMLTCRIFIIGVKYGLFSEEHISLLRNIYLP